MGDTINKVRIAVSSADRGATLIKDVTFEELGIESDASSVVKPPDDLLAAITSNPALSAEERLTMYKTLISAYEQSVKQSANVPIEQRIASAVLDHLVEVHGWSTTDQPNTPYIKPEDIVVQQVDGVYVATAAAVMG